MSRRNAADDTETASSAVRTGAGGALALVVAAVAIRRRRQRIRRSAACVPDEPCIHNRKPKPLRGLRDRQPQGLANLKREFPHSTSIARSAMAIRTRSVGEDSLDLRVNHPAGLQHSFGCCALRRLDRENRVDRDRHVASFYPSGIPCLNLSFNPFLVPSQRPKDGSSGQKSTKRDALWTAASSLTPSSLFVSL